MNINSTILFIYIWIWDQFTADKKIAQLWFKIVCLWYVIKQGHEKFIAGVQVSVFNKNTEFLSFVYHYFPPICHKLSVFAPLGVDATLGNGCKMWEEMVIV